MFNGHIYIKLSSFAKQSRLDLLTIEELKTTWDLFIQQIEIIESSEDWTRSTQPYEYLKEERTEDLSFSFFKKNVLSEDSFKVDYDLLIQQGLNASKTSVYLGFTEEDDIKAVIDIIWNNGLVPKLKKKKTNACLSSS